MLLSHWTEPVHTRTKTEEQNKHVWWLKQRFAVSFGAPENECTKIRVKVKLCSQMKTQFSQLRTARLITCTPNEELWASVNLPPGVCRSLQAVFKYGLEKVEKQRECSGLTAFIQLSVSKHPISRHESDGRISASQKTKRQRGGVVLTWRWDQCNQGTAFTANLQMKPKWCWRSEQRAALSNMWQYIH